MTAWRSCSCTFFCLCFGLGLEWVVEEKLFNADFKKSWVHNLFIWFIFVLTDSVTIAIWSVISGDSFEMVLSDYQKMICSNLLNIIVNFMAYRIYLIFLQKINLWVTGIKTALFVLTINFFEIWVMCVTAIKIEDKNDGIIFMVMMAGFLFINVFLAYILSQISESYKYEYELSLSKQLNEMYLAIYNEIILKYEESRTVIHDIKKHISVLENIKDNSSQAKYLSSIYDKMNGLYNIFYCSNKILSIILSQKISYAKSKGITVKVFINDIHIDFIDDFDITAIFANLWDNAIEACDNVKESKYITMEMKRHNNFLIINLENSFNGIIKKEKEHYISTKPGHIGVGLKSIEQTVKKYNGVFIVSHNDVSFRSEITLCIE